MDSRGLPLLLAHVPAKKVENPFLLLRDFWFLFLESRETHALHKETSTRQDELHFSPLPFVVPV